MNRDRSGAVNQQLAASTSDAYMLPGSLVGSLVLFLLAAMVDRLIGSEASRFSYAASAFLTLEAVGLMWFGVVLFLRPKQRQLGDGALIGGLLAISR